MADASWYMMHIRPEGKTIPPTGWPMVSRPVVHVLGKGDDEAKLAADMKNPFWPKFQDDARPAWAPDFLRLGYAVLFKREGMPKLAVKLGIRNPAKMKAEGKDSKAPGPNGKRVLTFDDVYVVGVVPGRMPMYCPDIKLTPEAWWLATNSSTSPTAPYLAPGGATVAVGAERLADLVVRMLRTPNGYPRPLPVEENPADYSEFINPWCRCCPRVQGPRQTSTRKTALALAVPTWATLVSNVPLLKERTANAWNRAHLGRSCQSQRTVRAHQEEVARQEQGILCSRRVAGLLPEREPRQPKLRPTWQDQALGSDLVQLDPKDTQADRRDASHSRGHAH